MEATLSAAQAQQILERIHIRGLISVKLLKRHNHVFEITTGEKVLYLKTYTKDWYAGTDGSGAAQHEAGGFAALSARGIPAPRVVLLETTGQNPIRRPFLLTEQLRGRPLTQLLQESKPEDFRALLRATAQRLRQYHGIVFRFPGYVGDAEGPQAPPTQDGWLHFYCSAERMQREVLKWLENDRRYLPAKLFEQLHDRFSTIEKALAPEYAPARFIQGDCHAHQFFLFNADGQWQVSGSVDMEVAAAGAPICDLLKFCAEMAEDFSVQTRWWEPLFEGYGGAPDFERFRLLFLSNDWDARTDVQLVPRRLTAQTWEQLFNKS